MNYAETDSFYNICWISGGIYQVGVQEFLMTGETDSRSESSLWRFGDNGISEYVSKQTELPEEAALRYYDESDEDCYRISIKIEIPRRKPNGVLNMAGCPAEKIWR